MIGGIGPDSNRVRSFARGITARFALPAVTAEQKNFLQQFDDALEERTWESDFIGPWPG
jgi:hypothetical protein